MPARKTSDKGRRFIESQEGLVLHPYQDQTGHATIGYGHLIKAGEHFPNHITETEADALFVHDLQRFEAAVNSYGLDLTQGQFDALVDFAFNCGEGALAQLLSHGLDEVPNQLPRWCHSGGQVLQVLVRRRAAEVEMWMAKEA